MNKIYFLHKQKPDLSYTVNKIDVLESFKMYIFNFVFTKLCRNPRTIRSSVTDKNKFKKIQTYGVADILFFKTQFWTHAKLCSPFSC